MSEHHVSVTVNAPVHQVYEFFSHFNDFPKFMSFVKEVTYYDEQRSHWVTDVAGNQEWDAVNEDWVPDQQIGWRSINGLKNSGKVKFLPLGTSRTQVDVFLNYVPPAGIVGEAVDRMGYDSHFDRVLQQDLNNFAHMVELAPVGALDPMQSHYLFHEQSAVTQGKTTQGQQEAMAHDPMMQQDVLEQRRATIEQQMNQQQQASQAMQMEREQARTRQRHVEEEQRTALHQQAIVDQQQQQAEQQRYQEGEAERHKQEEQREDPVYGTIGGRGAALYKTAFGDQDARTERFPDHVIDPMTARNPTSGEKQEEQTTTPVSDTTVESPWRNSIEGGSPHTTDGGTGSVTE